MVAYADLANYGVDPWNNIENNERPFYDPFLRDVYMRNSMYSQHVTMKVDLNSEVKARTIYFNDLIPPRPNIAPIANRAMDATRLYSDSYQRQVTTERYGNGMALHRESQMFSYWRKNGTEAGLINIINQALGQVVVDHLDTLARNAFFRHPYADFGIAGASGFGGISGTTDILSTELLDEVWLSMRDVQRPYSALPQTYDPSGDAILCLTTAGAVHDLKREVGTGTGGLNFVDVNKYTDEGRAQLVRGELGTYRGMRFIDSPFAKLWNVGAIEVQTTIKAAVAPGDGAPDPATILVEGTRKVGQPGATHYIVVDDSTGFTVNEMVTIHKLRVDSAYLLANPGMGVTDGVKFDDPMKQDVEIYSIDTTTPGAHRIAIKEPYMMTGDTGAGLETDLGGTVYGYVTKAVTVHSALFLTPGLSSNALVAGVAQPPDIYLPPAIDDYLSMYRVTYDFYIKYALWDARAYRMTFLRGSNVTIGRPIFR